MIADYRLPIDDIKNEYMLRKYFLLIYLCISLLSSAQECEYTYSFFANSAMPGDHFYTHVSFRDGSSVKNNDGRIPVSEAFFHTPENALELHYQDAVGGSWTASVFYPARRGMDNFKQPVYLSFWIFSASEDLLEKDLPQVQLMYSDSSLSEVFQIPMVKGGTWQRVLVPVNHFREFDASHPGKTIGLVFSHTCTGTGGTHALFVDDVEFLQEREDRIFSSVPVIVAAKGYAMHVDIAWEKVADPVVHLVKIYRSEDGNIYEPAGIQRPFIDRFADFTGVSGKKYSYMITFLNDNYEESGFSLPAIASTLHLTDDELMTMVQEASFRYYWEGAEPLSGMARENIPGRQDMIATGASGFGIKALLVGTQRDFITREQAVARFEQILDFLEKAETFHGAFPHFIDGPTGKAVPFFGKRDNGADLVETSFLIQGLLAARQYFTGGNDREKLIREKITRIWQQVEWDWFRRYPDGDYLFWHWSPDREWVINHRLIGWNETMVTYLLAIASPAHPIPAEMYYKGWASQEITAQQYRSGWGQSLDGSMYTNGNTYYGIKLDVGVNNGGPLFFTHYSYMGYDPHFITDLHVNYFINNQNIATINYRYCLDNPKGYKGYGEDGWGLTASDGPYDYSADEPVLWQDHGKLTPTGAVSSFPYTPEESMKALKNYYFNYGHFLWGEYGFRDAFNLTNNWCSEIYMGLNQAPMTVMIENYRTGLIWKLFMQNREIREGLRRLEKEGTE